MKYKTNWYKHMSHENDFDELVIFYHSADISTVTALSDFLENHKNQTTVIFIPDKENLTESFLKTIETFISKYNYKIKLELAADIITTTSPDDVLFEDLKKASIPYLFDLYASNYTEVSTLLNYGVCEVAAVGDICFNIIDLSKKIHDAGAELSIRPDLAQGTSFDSPNQITDFYIRPEASKLYFAYIDILKFTFSENHYDMGALYEIYKKGSWLDTLDKIIIGGPHIVNPIALFDIQRMNCKKRCMKNGTCSVCQSIEQMSKRKNEKEESNQ